MYNNLVVWLGGSRILGLDTKDILKGAAMRWLGITAVVVMSSMVGQGKTMRVGHRSGMVDRCGSMVMGQLMANNSRRMVGNLMGHNRVDQGLVSVDLVQLLVDGVVTTMVQNSVADVVGRRGDGDVVTAVRARRWVMEVAGVQWLVKRREEGKVGTRWRWQNLPEVRRLSTRFRVTLGAATVVFDVLAGSLIRLAGPVDTLLKVPDEGANVREAKNPWCGVGDGWVGGAGRDADGKGGRGGIGWPLCRFFLFRLLDHVVFLSGILRLDLCIWQGKRKCFTESKINKYFHSCHVTSQ